MNLTGLSGLLKTGGGQSRDPVVTVDFLEQESPAFRGDFAPLEVRYDVQIENVSKIKLIVTQCKKRGLPDNILFCRNYNILSQASFLYNYFSRIFRARIIFYYFSMLDQI